MKNELIKIATQIVQKSGIHSLTIRELGQTVGIKSSSVMYHFKSKDGLIYELINSYSELFKEYLDSLNQEYNDPKIRIEKFIEVFENTLHNDKFCLAGMLASQNENIDNKCRKKTSEFFDYAQEFITKNLKNKENASELAKVIISSLEGSMMLDKLEKNSNRLNATKDWILTLM